MAAREELMALMRQFTVEADRYVDVASDRDSLYRTDLHALSIMMGAARAGLTVTPGLLREELNLSSPATTALVDRLDSAGHVTRRRSDVDRRQVHLEMTDKARTTGAMLFAPLARHINGALDRYTDADLTLLRDMMQDVTDATIAAKMEAQNDARDGDDAD
ncbi:MarR family transcriptional regulator [Arthrobacter agilis]|uniref:MarR family winged helix-turn-helix transcriptional regulator n=1 Tax=Arthrobacter agilis TaxID=37921 RepID=UPI000B34BC74|nr:MarR family transcriptional regulator [Arthrobacter agilis]OUM43094.1 MarR family transcriptional regulator [Arthrobacter agilis]PPB46038.1 MarR family transcriptional regulator [Arthrobacter agilis]TPV25580.1 MarR family transcriptional regulator [Arthrobacter agilis]VDR33346.1 MarR family [Arthrobacter agilis]